MCWMAEQPTGDEENNPDDNDRVSPTSGHESLKCEVLC